MNRREIPKRLAALLSDMLSGYPGNHDQKNDIRSDTDKSTGKFWIERFKDDMCFKMAIASSISKKSLLECLVVHGMHDMNLTEVRFKKSEEPDELPFTADFYNKNGEWIDTAEAIPIGTWSFGNDSFLWAWLNPTHFGMPSGLMEQYTESMNRIRHQYSPMLMQTYSGNVPKILELFSTDDEIIFDESGVHDKTFNEIVSISLDAIGADGRGWVQHSETGRTLFAFFFQNDSLAKTLIDEYESLITYWTRQLCLHRMTLLVSGELGSEYGSQQNLVAIKVVMHLFWSILDNPAGEASAPIELENRNWSTIVSFIRKIKASGFFRSAVTIHSEQPHEDMQLKEFLNHVKWIVAVLRERTGTYQLHSDDENIIREILPRVIKLRLADIARLK